MRYNLYWCRTNDLVKILDYQFMPRDLIKCYNTFTKLYMTGSVSAFILSTNRIKCHYWFYRSYKVIPRFIISKCNIDIKAYQLIRQFNINSNNDYFTYKTAKNGNLYRRKRDNIFRNLFKSEVKLWQKWGIRNREICQL